MNKSIEKVFKSIVKYVHKWSKSRPLIVHYVENLKAKSSKSKESYLGRRSRHTLERRYFYFCYFFALYARLKSGKITYGDE